MVSNEDREAAFHVIAEAIYGPAYGKASKAKSERVLDALVSHGWGPKPRVEAQRLNDMITACEADMTINPLAEYLESHGVEVTYD